MNNAELVSALRWCQKHGCSKYVALLDNGSCKYGGAIKILDAAADALEAQQKALDECAAQLAELATELERLKSSNDELRERQTYIDHWGNKWMTSGKDVPTEAYNHGFLDGEQAVSGDLRSVRKGEQE